MRTYESWGRYPRATQRVKPVLRTSEDPLRGETGVLPFGLGRSYGDVCLNDGGTLLDARPLDRVLGLDEEAGTLDVEAGASLGEILDLVVPRGLFLPVVPGTRFVTVGGAIANDVHGKNHHRAGTFGCHVESLELLRSSGERLVCSATRNPDLLRATIGGLGLTGLVLRARLRLRRVPSEHVEQETVRLRGLEDFLRTSEAADAASEFTVAWIDCLARGAEVGRGVLFRGDFAAEPGPPARRRACARLSVPFSLPFSPLNRFTVSAFNALYYRARSRPGAGRRRVHYRPYFFPLDAVGSWNRIYGRHGLLQLQCAVPGAAAAEGLRTILDAVARAGEGSFLSVLKRFGPARSPGLLSFPRAGVTLSLDFPNRGERTRALLRELHAMVRDHGGRIYAAKDAVMTPGQFHAQHGDVLPAFLARRDPAFGSSFWRRVMPGA